jgi:hypothetical protein
MAQFLRRMKRLNCGPPADPNLRDIVMAKLSMGAWIFCRTKPKGKGHPDYIGCAWPTANWAAILRDLKIYRDPLDKHRD